MRKAYRRELEIHAQKHALEILYVEHVTSKELLQIAKLVICQLSCELDRTGDKSGLTIELNSGVAIAANRQPERLTQ